MALTAGAGLSFKWRGPNDSHALGSERKSFGPKLLEMMIIVPFTFYTPVALGNAQPQTCTFRRAGSRINVSPPPPPSEVA